jgi:hypothetical protein
MCAQARTGQLKESSRAEVAAQRVQLRAFVEDLD